jgi:NAD(P)-dependent dehydrogenase (short-subunit alcohol dehydrogenase family)
MAGRLAGKTAVVTGAAAGIGKGCADMFRSEGAEVVTVDVRNAHYTCDLTSESQTNTLFATLGETLPKIDILVNAAAYAVFAPIEELSFADWRKTLECELDIVFLPTKAAWSLLSKSGSASIINFASVNAQQVLEGSPALAHCAGKGGVLAMTRQLAMEGATKGIRANTIAPGFIRTEATARHMDAEPALAEAVLRKNMIKRFGEPADIAYCATWLASDESGYVTGANIPVDAGATAW